MTASGDVKNSVEVHYEDEKIWITQRIPVILYELERTTINYYIKKIFEDSELEKTQLRGPDRFQEMLSIIIFK